MALLSITLSLISLHLDQEVSVRDYFIESFILLSRFSPLFVFMLIFSAPVRYIMSEVVSKVVTFSVLVTLVPHLVGQVDTVYYASWIQELRQSQNIDEFLNQIYFEINSGDRPLSMIFLFFITQPSSNDGAGFLVLPRRFRPHPLTCYYLGLTVPW